MLQVCDLHEGLVEVVQLQDAGQQEEAWNQNTAEQLGQLKRLEANISKSGGQKHADVSDVKGNTPTSLQRPPLILAPFVKIKK